MEETKDDVSSHIALPQTKSPESKSPATIVPPAANELEQQKVETGGDATNISDSRTEECSTESTNKQVSGEKNKDGDARSVVLDTSQPVDITSEATDIQHGQEDTSPVQTSNDALRVNLDGSNNLMGRNKSSETDSNTETLDILKEGNTEDFLTKPQVSESFGITTAKPNQSIVGSNDHVTGRDADMTGDEVNSGLLERSECRDLNQESSKGDKPSEEKGIRPHLQEDCISSTEHSVFLSARQENSRSDSDKAEPDQVSNQNISDTIQLETADDNRSTVSDLQYTVPSEAEREEEMRAMRRDLCEDQEHNLVEAVPKAASNVITTTSNTGTINSFVIKKEPDNDHEYEAHSGEAEQINPYSTAPDTSVHSQTINARNVASDSVKVTDWPQTSENAVPTLDSVPVSTQQSAPSNKPNRAASTSSEKTLGKSETPVMQSGSPPETSTKFASALQYQLDCLLHSPLPTYKPTPVPEKFKEFAFSCNLYKCEACDDTFMFRSSLDTHMNRKSMTLFCNYDRCSKVREKKVYTNRCSYLMHLKTHGNIGKHLTEGTISFNLSAPSPEMMDTIKDMVTTPKTETSGPEIFSGFGVDWKCLECNKTLPNAKELASHFVPSSEVEEGKNMCDICKKCLRSPCSLSAHRRTHSRQKPFVCPECGQQFLGKWEAFQKHLGLKCFHIFRAASFKCPLCDVALSSPDKITLHVASHKEIYFKCNSCPMAFKTFSSVKAHAVSSHAQNTCQVTSIYKCAVCDTVFHSIKQLETHTGVHVMSYNKNPHYSFRCWFCPQLFDDKDILQGHLESIHRVRHSTLFCDICGEDLDSLAAFFIHLEKHNGEDSEEVVPTKANTEGTQTYVLANFESVPESPVGVKARKPKIRKQQSRSATAGNMFCCSACEFKCSKANMTDVHAHIRNHREEGIYLCPNCFTAKFESLTDLRRHMFLCRKKKALQKNSSPKTKKAGPHICHKCSTNFGNEDDLIGHLQSQHGVGSVQFPCHLCGLTYDTRKNLHQHIQMVHEGKKHVFICWICQSKNVKKTFTIASKLEKHLMVKHRVPKHIIEPDKFPRLLPGLDDKDTVVEGSLKRQHSDEDRKAPIKRLKLAGDTTFTCAKCDFSSEDKQAFLAHIKLHKTESSSRQCPECGLCFSVLPTLKKHLIMVHKLKDIDSYLCVSGFNNQTKEEPLSSDTCHSTEEGSEKDDVTGNPLECRVCHKTFETETSVKIHMRTHGMAFIRSKRAVVTSGSGSSS